jgi:hypothetical protein
MLLEMLLQHVLYPNRSRQGVYFAAAYSILHGMILYTILQPRLRPVPHAVANARLHRCTTYYVLAQCADYPPAVAATAPHSPSRVTSHPAQSPVPLNPTRPQDPALPLLLPQHRPL